MTQKIGIGLLGLGNVGRGVFKIINNLTDWPHKTGAEVSIKKILVRNPDKHRSLINEKGVLTKQWEDIINDPEINLVVEVIGGLEPAKTYIIDALKAGKNVVTANKDLLALHGRELLQVAALNGKDLYFEASVAGGIPIIRPLKSCLAGNNIEKIMGIVNGTTNYILSKMDLEACDFAEVLEEAQSLGYAEADPTSDIEGLDAARKIAILASIAFHTRVSLNDVYVEGIAKISPADFVYAKELGYTIKLLGIASEDNGMIEARVHPVFIPITHPLATVKDAYNAVFVNGDAVGETMFFGKGAGEMPTASAVVGDIVDIARNMVRSSCGRISCTCYENKQIKPIGEVENSYYLRLNVIDEPGVLASIASVFGNHRVSLASVIQKQRCENQAEIVVITHRVKENNVQDALKVIGSMSIVKDIANLIRVERGRE